jgi:Lrp/AsnC family transcriptional regulator for asnA, asnC and gidA
MAGAMHSLALTSRGCVPGQAGNVTILPTTTVKTQDAARTVDSGGNFCYFGCSFPTRQAQLMSDIDEVDRQIVDLLIEDGRMPCAEIARRLGSVSERVVRYRIGRLVTSGIIHIGAIANPRSLGYQVVADVFLQVDAASVLDVARRLAEYECISYVGSSMGEMDVSVQVVGHDNAEVYAFVTDVIAKIPGVRKTSTIIVPQVLKDVYQWRIPSSGCANKPGREG